jgi:hypothetical protein
MMRNAVPKGVGLGTAFKHPNPAQSLQDIASEAVMRF